MSKELVTSVVTTYEQLKADRANWDSHWQEIAYYVVPKKDDVFLQQGNIGGEKKGKRVYDASPIHANELLAAALHGMLTNPAVQWFELSTGNPELDKQDAIKKFLQESVRRIHQMLNNSNFQTEIHEFYLDIGSFGSAVLRMEEDDDFVMQFSSRPIWEHYITENHKGQVDGVYRCLRMTVRQIQQRFGEDVFEPHEMHGYLKTPNKELEIIHAVFPRTDIDRTKKNKKNKPIASIYILKAKKKLLEESGFNEFPYVVARWSKISGEKYGRSPAMKAFPDILMINSMMKTIIRGAQKIVDPPLQVPDDGVLGPVRTIPGGTNYYRAGTNDRIEPLTTGARPDIGLDILENVRQRIREAFFIDQLQLNEGPQMTATEVLQRTEEKLRMMGPILGRLHFEFLRPLIDRVFAVMLRKGLLPPAPQELSGANLEVRFSSMIARAQRSSEADNITRVMGTIAPFIEVDPSVMDNIDLDGMVRHVGNIFNVSHEVFKDVEVVEEVRAQRAAVQEQQLQQQQQLGEAEIVNKLS